MFFGLLNRVLFWLGCVWRCVQLWVHLFEMTIDFSVLFSAAISPHLTSSPFIADLRKVKCWSAVPCRVCWHIICASMHWALEASGCVTVAVIRRSAVAAVCCEQLLSVLQNWRHNHTLASPWSDWHPVQHCSAAHELPLPVTVSLWWFCWYTCRRYR